MPRNASGVYVLPQAAFVPNTTISSAAVNSDLSDLGNEITFSLATTGVSSMIGPFKAAAGSPGSPSITFASALRTGFYLAGTDQIGWASAGVPGATFNNDRSVNWLGNASWNGTGTFNGTTSFIGTATFTLTPVFLAGFGPITASTLSVTSTSSFTGKASFTSTDSMAVANGSTGQRNGAPSAGDFRYNSTLNVMEYWNGSAWIELGLAPTVQRFTSGTSLTYTPTAGTIRIRVRMCGGGGGGGAGTTGTGGTGGTTSFASWTAIGGNGGAAQGGPAAGGTGGTNGTGTLIMRLTGGQGGGGNSTASQAINSGMGGNNPFGGAGASVSNNQNGGAGAANTGAGGGGGGYSAGVTGDTGAGGGAGEYVEFYVTSPTAITFTVGGGGGGGSGSGFVGGAGGAGQIVIEEFYL